jgi:hypothetical protein
VVSHYVAYFTTTFLWGTTLPNIPWNFLFLKMKAVRSSETSGYNYPLTQRHIPKELNPQLNRCEKLETSTLLTCYCYYLGAQHSSEKRLSASSRPPVRLSFRMNQIGSHWTDFHENWYFLSQKSVEKIQKKKSAKIYRARNMFYIVDRDLQRLSNNSKYKILLPFHVITPSSYCWQRHT